MLDRMRRFLKTSCRLGLVGRQKSTRGRQPFPCLEALEDRFLPATYYWVAQQPDVWSNPKAWADSVDGSTPAAAPTTNDSLIFDSTMKVGKAQGSNTDASDD